MKKRILFSLIVVVLLALGFISRPKNDVHAEDTRVITVHLDGEVKTVATNAATVSQALQNLNANVGPEDKTEPELSAPVEGGEFTINVYRARPITVVDGANNYTVMTAERSPRQIAEEAGFATKQEDEFGFERAEDPYEGAPGTQMVIKRAKTITFDLYGTSANLSTNEVSVAGLLEERGVRLDPGDEINVPLEARIADGMTVSIARVNKNVETKEEVAAFGEEIIRDAQQPTTYKKIQSPGKDGKKLVTYEIVSRNGGEPIRTAIKEVITEQPVKQVVVVGAKSNTFGGDFGAALGKLRSCEGAYTSNTGNGYYGAYQFNTSTWNSNAPAAYKGVLPSNAPPSVQDEAAANLYKARGWQPWPACSRKLGLQDIYR
jgi:resuscitation-promoting factor RpfB